MKTGVQATGRQLIATVLSRKGLLCILFCFYVVSINTINTENDNKYIPLPGEGYI